MKQINKRLEKIEARKEKKNMKPYMLPIIECWKDGTPINEEEAKKLAEVEKVPYSGKGIRCITVCAPWMSAEERDNDPHWIQLEKASRTRCYD